MRGRGALEPGGPLTEAAKLLEQVVARDPNYAPAWGLLGQAYAYRTVGIGTIAPARSRVQHVHDPADHTPIIDPMRSAPPARH